MGGASLVEQVCRVLQLTGEEIVIWRKLGEARVRVVLDDGRVMTFSTAELRAWTPGAPLPEMVVAVEPRPGR